METTNSAHNELPDEPEHSHESEASPEQQTGSSELEQEEPASPSSEPIEASQQEEPAPVSTDEADASTVIQPVEQQANTVEVTEAAQTILDDEQETTEVEQEPPSLPDTQADELTATGNVPTRQKSKYTPWMQVLAAVVLICVIGGIVFAVRQSTNGYGQVTQGAPTPIPLLNVTKWCTVNTAPIDAQAGQVSLGKVAALSANDAWMLGAILKDNNAVGNTGYTSTPLLEHWYGKIWSIVSTADTSADTSALLKQLQSTIQQLPGSTKSGPTSSEVVLSDMAVLSDNNIWVVGQISVSETAQTTLPGSPGGSLTMTHTVGQPLIEHWDGHTWQIVTSPTGATIPGSFVSGNSLTSISALSANNIWAMGTQADKSHMSQPGDSGVSDVFVADGAGVPLVEHWDGTSWTEQQLPTSLQQSGLTFSDIHALSANDVWSFDQNVTIKPIQVQPGNPAIPLPGGITAVPFPGSGTSTTTIVQESVGLPEYSAHILHWNGQSWSEMQLPDVLNKTVSVNNMTVIADNNIWAFGEETLNANGTPVASSTATAFQWGDGSGTPADLNVTNVIYHWDGTAWSKVATDPGVDSKSNLVRMSVIAPDNLWLLGNTSKFQPLLEHWNGKAWSGVSMTSPTYGSVTNVTVVGQRAWASVEQYSAPNTQDDVSPGPIGAVLETNC